MKRIIFLIALIFASLACCVWAGGPQSTVRFEDIQGIVGIANGGTGATTVASAAAALLSLPSTWINATLVGTWTTFAGYATPASTLRGDGTVELRGGFYPGQSGYSYAFQVPASHAPSLAKYLPALTSDGDSVMLYLRTNGYGSFVGSTSGKIVTMDGLSYEK